MTKQTAKDIHSCWKRADTVQFLTYCYALFMNKDISKVEYLALCDKVGERKQAQSDEMTLDDIPEANNYQ